MPQNTGATGDARNGSEEQLLGMEFPSTLPFDIGPEYQSMVSQVLDPRRSGLETQGLKSLRPSDQVHLQLQDHMHQEPFGPGDYFEGGMGEINTESEYGQGGCVDIREYLRPLARDAEHLCQLLIEQKICRLDIMDRISEEHSMDLDHSIMTHAANKSAIFKDAKLMHSDSWWLGGRPGGGLTTEGRHLLNTSFGSRRDISRGILNSSNQFSRELNASFKLMASQGDLGSARMDEPDLRGLLLRNSSFKHNKFPPKRKISLKVDGKKFQESQFFHVPGNKSHRQGLYSPDKRELVTRLKTVRNSDVTERRRQAQEPQHSRSLNNSGIHNMARGKPGNFAEFDLRSYSVSKEDHKSIGVVGFELGARPEKAGAVQADEGGEGRHSEGPLPTERRERAEKESERDTEKRPSETLSDGPDFEYSCIELNESRENHLDTESIRNIVDPCLVPLREDSMITYDAQGKTATRPDAQLAPFQLKSVDAMGGFKKIKFGNGDLDKAKRTLPGTTESWMKHPSRPSQLGESFPMPRKISEIPVENSTQKGGCIVYGGDMTPYHKRSETIEANFQRSPTLEREKEPEQAGSRGAKQNITDLVKMIIQETEQGPQDDEKDAPAEQPKGEEEEPMETATQGREDPERGAEEEPRNESEQFDSCMTNMPSIVNIESTANLQTIFDINYNPQDQQAKKAREGPRSKLQGSMLTDEQLQTREVFRVISTSDNDCDSEEHIDSILLMPNEELAKRRKHSAGQEAAGRDSEVSYESEMGGLKGELDWARLAVLPEAKGQLFKKASRNLQVKKKFQEIRDAKSASMKERFRRSKLGLKITRMSRKAGRHEVFKMRSPTTLSIANNADLSDPRQASSKSHLKRPLKNPKYRRLRDKLWESVVSSKNNESGDTGSRFDRTLGSVSIQSLLKKSSETPLSLIKRRDSKASRGLRHTDDKLSWKADKPRYQSGHLKQDHMGDLELLRDPLGLLSSKADTNSTSRVMKSSAQGSNSIYSKRSQKEAVRKQMRRSNTLNHQRQRGLAAERESLRAADQRSETPLISEDMSQREIDADLLRLRNKKEIESKFQNIYKPRDDSREQSPARDDFSRRSKQSGSGRGRGPFRREESRRGGRHQPRLSRADTGKRTGSIGAESQGRESDSSSLFQQHRNSGNESGFLPFPRSIKLREERTNQSKMSEMRDTATPGVKEYYSGNVVGLNLNQREEYGILSGEIDQKTNWASLRAARTRNGHRTSPSTKRPTTCRCRTTCASRSSRASSTCPSRKKTRFRNRRSSRSRANSRSRRPPRARPSWSPSTSFRTRRRRASRLCRARRSWPS